MDQQNPNQNPSSPELTEADIARLEAEAVAAVQRGDEVLPEEDVSSAPRPEPVRSDFVPYVDDVPEPEPAPRAAEASVEDDDDDEEYIPSEWEKRIDRLTPQQWKAWQIAGGCAVGGVVIASLFAFGPELSTYGLILAAVLAILMPRYLERAWRRKLTVARTAMVVTMVVGLLIAFIIVFSRNGFTFARTE